MKHFFSLIVLVALASCAHGPKIKKAPVAEKQQEKPRDPAQEAIDIYAKLTAKLKGLITKAKEAGPESVQFLGSDIYLKASAASMSGDTQTAGFLFENLSKLYPEDEYVKTRFAVEMVRQGQLAKAKKILQEVHKKGKNPNPKVALLLGAIYSSENKHLEAAKLYKKIVKSDSSNLDACLLLVKERLKLDPINGYPRAMATLNACDKKNKQNGALSFYMGKISLDFNKIGAAKKYFKQTLRRDESYFQAALGLGLIYEQEEKFDSAVKNYESFLVNNASNKTILSRLVQVLFSQGKYKKIIPYAETLVQLDASDLNLKVRLGILYSDSKMFDKAIKTFQEILKEVPDSDKIHYYLGAIYQETQEFEPALQSYAKVNDQSTLYLDSNLQIAQILKTMAIAGSEEEREKSANRLESFVWEQSKKSPVLQVKLSMVLATYLEATEEVGRAIAAVEKGAEDKSLDESQLYYLASLYEKNKNPLKAKQMIEKVLVINPNNAHALNFLGYTMLENNENLGESLKLIQKAVKLAPKDGYIRDSLGWYFYKTGQNQKALKHLLIAVKNVKNDATILKHLGLVYKTMRNYAKARKYFNLSLENIHSVADKQEIQNELSEIGQKRLPAAH